MHRFSTNLLSTSLSVLCLVCPCPADESPHVAQSQNGNSSPLEIRISPLRWEKACLILGLDLLNRSSVPIFLTEMGPYFDIALDVSKDDPSNKNVLKWVNVWGASDILTSDANPLAPNSPLHKNFCIGEKVWVVNQKKETRREIPIRGKMRVSVSYFATEDIWKKNRTWHDDHQLNPWKSPEEIAPTSSTVTFDIPCPTATCKQGCGRPPIGFPDEVRIVPDVFYLDPDWNRRGEALTNELNRKYPLCAEVN